VTFPFAPTHTCVGTQSRQLALAGSGYFFCQRFVESAAASEARRGRPSGGAFAGPGKAFPCGCFGRNADKVLEADYWRRAKPRSLPVVTGRAAFALFDLMRLPCSSTLSKGGRLHVSSPTKSISRFIFGSNDCASAGCPAWQSGHTYAKGDYVCATLSLTDWNGSSAYILGDLIFPLSNNPGTACVEWRKARHSP
jgi:hypothetical protein